MAWVRERSRSRRPEARRATGAPPLVDFLFVQGLLDESSVELLKRAPRALAEEALLALGPEVRDPPAFVTQRLGPQLAGPGGAKAGEAPGGAAMVPWAAPLGQAGGDVIMVHSQGEARPLLWRSQGEAVAELLAWGVLDEGSADFLLKAPEREAKEVVAALGPDVRNPPAFVTRKLRELRAADASAQQAAPAAGAAPFRGGPAMAAMAREHIPVHCGGAVAQLPWVSKEQAAEMLVGWGVLDEGSADFLLKAPEHEAKQIVASLGPDVRNPSAYVTRKLKALMREGVLGTEPAMPGPEVVPFHHNGALLSLQWFSKEQALGELVRSGVLDEGSADFLAKAPEREAKQIVASLGPDVRNPSAYVTRKMKELRGSGPPLEHPGQPPSQAIMVHHNGMPFALEWTSAGRAIGQLASMGVLDEGSADYLRRLPDGAAKEIVAALGPEVRNPSAFVTKRVKAALQGGAPAMPMHAELAGVPFNIRGELGGAAVQDPQVLSIYHNGASVALTWHSQSQVLGELVGRGILDQRSADFLAKLPEGAMREIVSSLGPDVRNPSAFVTKEVKKWLS